MTVKARGVFPCAHAAARRKICAGRESLLTDAVAGAAPRVELAEFFGSFRVLSGLAEVSLTVSADAADILYRQSIVVDGGMWFS